MKYIWKRVNLCVSVTVICGGSKQLDQQREAENKQIQSVSLGGVSLWYSINFLSGFKRCLTLHSDEATPAEGVKNLAKHNEIKVDLRFYANSQDLKLNCGFSFLSVRENTQLDVIYTRYYIRLSEIKNDRGRSTSRTKLPDENRSPLWRGKAVNKCPRCVENE